MVRNYVRKLTRQNRYTEEDMENAMWAVKTNRMSLRCATRNYNIPKSTLCRRLKWRTLGLSIGRCMAVPLDYEVELAKQIKMMEMCGFTVTKSDVLEIVGDFVRLNKLKTPFRNGVPGYDWFQNFKKRHGVSINRPQAVEPTVGNVHDVVHPLTLTDSDGADQHWGRNTPPPPIELVLVEHMNEATAQDLMDILRQEGLVPSEEQGLSLQASPVPSRGSQACMTKGDSTDIEAAANCYSRIRQPPSWLRDYSIQLSQEVNADGDASLDSRSLVMMDILRHEEELIPNKASFPEQSPEQRQAPQVPAPKQVSRPSGGPTTRHCRTRQPPSWLRDYTAQQPDETDADSDTSLEPGSPFSSSRVGPDLHAASKETTSEVVQDVNTDTPTHRSADCVKRSQVSNSSTKQVTENSESSTRIDTDNRLSETAHSTISHISKRAGGKSYSCASCNKSFSNRRFLSQHTKTNRREPYCCAACDATFRQKQRYLSHARTHMADRKLYLCPVCSKSFNVASLFISHYKLHNLLE